MDVDFIIAGYLTRDYILPPSGYASLDVPGGSALYAAAGAETWSAQIGISARVGEDYPKAWLKQFRSRGIDTSGVEVIPGNMDVRAFHAFDANMKWVRGSPVTQFAHRGLRYPKSLLGYSVRDITHQFAEAPPLPAHYLEARSAHLCAMPLLAQQELLGLLAASGVSVISIELPAAELSPSRRHDVLALARTATLVISEESALMALFQGVCSDLRDMSETLLKLGPEALLLDRDASGYLAIDRNGNSYSVPAFPIPTRNPIGGRDAFCGGAIAGYRQRYDPLDACLYGAVSASINRERSGADYAAGTLRGLAEARLQSLRELVRRT